MSVLQRAVQPTFSRNYKKMYKKVSCTCEVVFCSNQTYCFFPVFVAFAAWLALHDFIFCFSKLQISTRASLLALAKSIYYVFTEITVSVLNASSASFPTINIMVPNFQTVCYIHLFINNHGKKKKCSHPFLPQPLLWSSLKHFLKESQNDCKHT